MHRENIHHVRQNQMGPLRQAYIKQQALKAKRAEWEQQMKQAEAEALENKVRVASYQQTVKHVMPDSPEQRTLKDYKHKAGEFQHKIIFAELEGLPLSKSKTAFDKSIKYLEANERKWRSRYRRLQAGIGRLSRAGKDPAGYEHGKRTSSSSRTRDISTQPSSVNSRQLPSKTGEIAMAFTTNNIGTPKEAHFKKAKSTGPRRRKRRKRKGSVRKRKRKIPVRATKVTAKRRKKRYRTSLRKRKTTVPSKRRRKGSRLRKKGSRRRRKLRPASRAVQTRRFVTAS